MYVNLYALPRILSNFSTFLILCTIYIKFIPNFWVLQMSRAMRKCLICEQQRRRSACPSARSDQHLCCSLLRHYNISRFFSQNFKTLASFYSCADWFVSGLVGNSRRHSLTCCGSNKCTYCDLSQLMRLWHFSSSVNLFFKHAYTAIQWG